MDLKKTNIFILFFSLVSCSTCFGQNFNKDYEAPFGLWQTTSSWVDFDNDQDYDFIVSGWNPDGFCETFVFQNDNQTFHQTPTSLKGLQRGSIDTGDFNNDGLIDIIVSGKDDNHTSHTIIYLNEGGFNFSENAILEGVFDSSVKIGDFNNDGQRDIALTGENNQGIFITEIYQNELMNFSAIESDFPGTRLGTVDWADYNNDGFIDFTLTGEDMNFNFPSNLYENKKNDRFDLVETPFVGFMYTGNDWGDFDDDGDLDLAISGETMNAMFLTHIFINNDSKFTLKDGNYANTMNGTVRWGDFSNDGKLDLIATGVSGSNKFSATLYQNTEALEIIDSNLPGVAIRSTGIWADIDADLDLDLLLTGSRADDLNGIIHVYENASEAKNTRPLPPTNLAYEIVGSDIHLKWNKGIDNETNSLSYNVYLKDLNTGEYIISPESHANGFRKVQKAGNAGLCLFKIVSGLDKGVYEWGVQSIDNSLVGSPFSTSSQFIIGEILSVTTANEIELFPNPVGTQLNLRVNLASGNLKITDLSGKVLITDKYKKGNNVINMKSLKSGVYLLEIMNNESSRKFRILKE